MDSTVFMSKIEKIEGQVMEEVDGSREYTNCAAKWAGENATISSSYASMAKQELEHATKLNGFLNEMKSNPELTEDQVAVVKFLVEMNAGQIKKAAIER